MRENKFRAWDEGNLVMHMDFEYITSRSTDENDEGSDWIIYENLKEGEKC